MSIKIGGGRAETYVARESRPGRHAGRDGSHECDYGQRVSTLLAREGGQDSHQAGSPVKVVLAWRTVDAWGPAALIDQIIIARATMGSVMALTRKRGRSCEGWMRQKGNWSLRPTSASY